MRGNEQISGKKKENVGDILFYVLRTISKRRETISKANIYGPTTVRIFCIGLHEKFLISLQAEGMTMPSCAADFSANDYV